MTVILFKVSPHHFCKMGYKCKCCSENCKSTAALKGHMKSHEKENVDMNVGSKMVEKSYACTKCDKTFMDIKMLKAHLKGHSEKTDRLGHTRDQCGERCTTPAALKTHMKSHIKRNIDTKRHKCPDCGKGFRSPASLKSHMVIPLTYTKSHEKRHSHTVTQHWFCFHSLTTGIQYWSQCALFPMVRHTVSGSRFYEI